MTPSLYFQCALLALLGQLFNQMLIMKSLNDKARAANVIFKIGDYLKTDGFTIIASFISIVICLLLANTLFDWQPVLLKYAPVLFAAFGYMGSDFGSRLFGIANKRINAAIDAKTTQADTANGTLDAPTPAAKPGPKA